MASIAAKLAASEREADAARVRAKIKAARAKRIAEKTPGAKPSRPVAELSLEVNSEASVGGKVEKESQGVGKGKVEGGENRGRKRKAAAGAGAGGKANRRRSTLSPWELESLILGGVGGESPGKG